MNWRDTIAQLRTFGPRFACLLTGMLLGGSLAWAHTPTIVPGTGLGNTVPFYNSQGISTASNNLLFNGTAFTAGVWQATSISTTFTDAKVVSVSCTTITCSGTNPAAFSVGTAAITPVKGGTGLDTSASSGVFSVNAGSWIVNNVLTTNRLLIAAAGNTITSSANLTFDGSVFTMAGSGSGNDKVVFGGSWSPGNGFSALNVTTAVTAISGGSAFLQITSGAITTQASGTHPNIFFWELTPSITSGGATITNAGGILINSLTAPTTTTNASGIKINGPGGATNNYALWVASGGVRFDGALGMGVSPGSTAAATITGQSTADLGPSIYFGSTTQLLFRGGTTNTQWNNAANSVGNMTLTDAGNLQILTSGLTVGTPTGGDKGAGTINVATDIFKNNTAYTNPDYVLEHWATGQITKHAGKEGADLYHGLHSLSDIETYARTTYSLPLMNQNRTGGAFARGDLLMATVEEAYLYLFQHDHRLDTLEARIKALEERK